MILEGFIISYWKWFQRKTYNFVYVNPVNKRIKKIMYSRTLTAQNFKVSQIFNYKYKSVVGNEIWLVYCSSLVWRENLLDNNHFKPCWNNFNTK